MIGERRITIAWLVFLLAGLTAPLMGQVSTSAIAGYVFDSSGQAIFNAAVDISDPVHSVVRTTTTDISGRYRFLGLTPATYTVTASAPGFAPAQRRELPLRVATELRLDFHLAVAGARETVEVRASAQEVQTDSSELGAVQEQRWIDRLPLNRRDFLQLAMLTAGVAPPAEGSEQSQRGGFAMHAGGGREEYNNFLLDGVDNNDPYTNRYVVEPPVDSIQEFRIVTNSYSAEYGRSAAGQVNVITRQGSNAWHGSAYEYLRNRVFDARNYFETDERSKYIRNQFGFSLGGPVARTRTFMFLSTDFLREREGLIRRATVPTEAQRSGDLSSIPAPIVDPFTRQPFPGNIIPPERINPDAGNVLALFPLPNQPGLVNNLVTATTQRDDTSQVNARLDHRFSSADDITVRYSTGIVDLFEPYTEGTETTTGFGDFVNDRVHNAMISYRRILGPRAVNSLRLAFNRYARELLPQNQVNLGETWGSAWAGMVPGYPSITVAGYSKVGDAINLPILRAANTYQVADSLTFNRGAHIFKLGGEIRWLQLNSTLEMLTRGSLSFSGFLSGSGISDLLLGLPSFDMLAQADNRLRMRSTAYNLYFEDSWKLRHDLNLDIGLRYEYNTPAVDADDHMSTLNLQTMEVVPVGTNGVSRSSLRPDHNNLGPRVGIAWSPRPGSVIRAGYGIYYDSGMLTVNTAQYFNPPEFTLAVYFPSPTSLLTLQNPFPTQSGLTPPPTLSVLSPDLSTSYLQQWNLTVEHEFGRWGVGSLSYAASKGSKLIRARDLNQPPPGPGDVQSRRPYPQYGSIFFIESAAGSSYQSLQAQFHRRIDASLGLWAVYTWSRSIDDASAFLGTTGDPNFPQDSHNLRAQRGDSSFDVRQRLAFACVLTLPRTNRWTRNTELQALATFQSGQPFTPVLRFDNSNTGNNGGQSGYDHPNQVHDPMLSHRTAERWFDTSAFVIPPQYTFGDAGRNIVRGPGFASFDTSLVRHFKLNEKWQVSVQAQAFNLLNRPNFELPQLYVDEPATFGTILAAKAPRQLQFALRVSF